MTVRSEHEGYIRGLSTITGASYGPVDASAARDAIINNTNHLVSECTQTRIAITRKAGAYYEQSAPSTTTYQLIDKLDPFAFPMNFSTVVLVPHIKVSISAAGTASFRMRLTFYGDESLPSVGDAAPNVADFTTTSTTAVDANPGKVWISYASIQARGFDPNTGTYPWMPAFASLDGSGNVSTKRVLWAQLEVWAKSSVDTSLPRVHGLYAREYIG
jgi:hypothetical protein